MIQTPHVGVVVGTSATAGSPVSPDGFLAGSTGQITVTGTALEAVTAANAVGTTGITFNTLKANTAGTQLTANVTVDSAVQSGSYRITLTQTRGGVTSPVVSVSPGNLAISIGKLPTQVNSMTPIVLEQSKQYTFVARGTNLKDVYQLHAEPNSGLVFGAVQWSSDALGEKLSVPLTVDANATIGSRVIRLKVPGGITSGSATPATTVTVIVSQ